MRLSRRGLLLAGAGIALPLAMPRLLRAQGAPLRVGDQRGNARAVLEASGALKGFEDRIAWSEFPAAAPLVHPGARRARAGAAGCRRRIR